MSAFVQINLGVWVAWQRGELSHDEFLLAVYLAFKCDFRTGELTTTLDAIASDLGWDVVRSTTGRRLARLEHLGFVETAVIGRQPKHKHVVRPTASLLKSGRLAQPYATIDATSRAALEPAQGEDLKAPSAAIDATFDAHVEEKRREEITKDGSWLKDKPGPNEEDSTSSNGTGEGPFQLSEEVLLEMARAAETDGSAVPDEVYSWMQNRGLRQDDDLVFNVDGEAVETLELPSPFTCSDCGRFMGNAGGIASHRKSGRCRERVTS